MNRNEDLKDCGRDGGDRRQEGGPPPQKQDHVEQTVDMWRKAAEKAWFDLHVEMLKERFKKAHGENIGAVADRIVVAMHAEWKAYGSVEAADLALRTAVRDGFQKGPQ